ncbi:hypothetical protein HY383_03215 [Candidatus Daviesbacteria bacterium]|nr:hypothetical protein [Candidatus Daviesbacteria bacterium]
MPKLSSLFDSFDNLDQILPEAVASWLKPVPAIPQVENYLANKILYPQTLPQTEFDMQMDLAILREALKINGPKPGLGENSPENSLLGDNPFLNIVLRKVLIPAKFLNFTPNLAVLTQVFIDALLLDRRKEDTFEDLWTVVLINDTDEIVGSIMMAQFNNNDGVMDLKLLGKNYRITKGNIIVVPCSANRCEIAYKLQNGHVLGKNENAVEVYGGNLGIVIDGRSL